MKSLSIQQPWSYLICAGYKDVENRTWHIADRGIRREQLPQRIYVHAGKKIDTDLEIWEFIGRRVLPATLNDLLMLYEADRLSLGAIIGEVDIVDCVEDSKSPWAVPGQYHFVLANPVLYPTPIPCRGMLGFFTPDLPNSPK